jgi:subtilisin-like proprotein convertase family protein
LTYRFSGQKAYSFKGVFSGWARPAGSDTGKSGCKDVLDDCSPKSPRGNWTFGIEDNAVKRKITQLREKFAPIQG